MAEIAKGVSSRGEKNMAGRSVLPSPNEERSLTTDLFFFS